MSLILVLRWSMVPPQGVLYPMTVPQPCLGVACIQFCLSAVYMGRSPGHLVISGTGVPAQYPQTPRPPARGVLCPASLTSAHPSQQLASQEARRSPWWRWKWTTGSLEGIKAVITFLVMNWMRWGIKKPQPESRRIVLGKQSDLLQLRSLLCWN